MQVTASQAIQYLEMMFPIVIRVSRNTFEALDHEDGSWKIRIDPEIVLIPAEGQEQHLELGFNAWHTVVAHLDTMAAAK